MLEVPFPKRDMAQLHCNAYTIIFDSNE